MSENTDSRIIRPRQRRAFATLAAILAEVESLVVEEGLEAVTTTRVAARTGLAVGTVYRYFADRESLLLAAYDATFIRLVGTCHTALESMPADIPAQDAARRLLDVYLDAAEAIPAHAGLLKAMRQLRPLESGRSSEPGQIVSEIVAPFFARFMAPVRIDGLRLQMIGSVLATMVDLYLVTPGERERAFLRAELEAQLLFMLGRAG